MTDLLASGDRRLKLFPAVHQIAYFPHQGLMAGDDRLGRFPILIETGRRHRLLDLADGALTRRNLCLELFDLRAFCLRGFLLFAYFGVRTFFFGVIDLRLRRWRRWL